MDQVAAGVYRLGMDVADIGAAMTIMDRFAGLDVGLTDASLVVLADRYDVRDVLTLDERHFRSLRDSRGRPFRILPADA